MYELPIGPNKSFLSFTDWRRHFFEGWALSGVTTFSAGRPLALEAEYNELPGVALEQQFKQATEKAQREQAERRRREQAEIEKIVI